MTPTAELTDDLKREIVREASDRLARLHGNAMWDREDLAFFFNASKSKVSEIVATPSFPRAVRITPSMPRWYSSEVREWAEVYREKK